MTKLKTHTALAAVLVGAMTAGAATPSWATDDNDQILGAATANSNAKGYYSKAQVRSFGSASAFAYEPGRSAAALPFNGNVGNDVFVNGHYVGSDPDPRIRASIRAEERGNQSGNGGNGDGNGGSGGSE